jgi:type II secretory pathway pseudopilin PulG
MKRQLHSRKGVTVAEVVIALVIIAAISAFTLSLIVMSIGVETKSESAIEVKNAAENAIECFRFAKSEAGVDSALFFACLKQSNENYESYHEQEVNGTTEIVIDEENAVDDKSIFRLLIDGCTITIKQTATSFSFVAMRGEEELENFTFPEGGAS